MSLSSATPIGHLRPLPERDVASLRRGRSDSSSSGPLIDNRRLALLVLLSAESMLFAAFVGAFLVFKLSAPFWPPLNPPRLPIGVTWANTVALLVSALTMKLAVNAARRAKLASLRIWLGITAGLGSLFLIVQGREWFQMETHGLHLSSGNYGGAFYLLIGLHGLHVACAVTWLLGVTVLMAIRGHPGRTPASVELCAIYWYFVCAVWPLLFYVLYF